MNGRCNSGKKSYPHAQDAWRVLEIQASRQWRTTHKRRPKPGGRAYKCRSCEGWHITTAKEVRSPPREVTHRGPRPILEWRRNPS